MPLPDLEGAVMLVILVYEFLSLCVLKKILLIRAEFPSVLSPYSACTYNFYPLNFTIQPFALINRLICMFSLGSTAWVMLLGGTLLRSEKTETFSL